MTKHYTLFILLAILSICLVLTACQIHEVSSEGYPSDDIGETDAVLQQTDGGTLAPGNSFENTPGGPSSTASITESGTSSETPSGSKSPSRSPSKSPSKPNTTSKTSDPVSKPGSKYALYVNRKQNVVTVYTTDSKGEYTVPVKAMVCSTGRNNGTPTGSFSISEKYTWRKLIGNVYGQYASRFNGGILFHSVPYKQQNKGTLKSEEYNKLGIQASDGCVRLSVEDAKWIFDNCSLGTKVVVFDSDSIGALGKPSAQKIPLAATWDPTDPDINNPWRNPYTINGAINREIQRNSAYDILNGVYVIDSYGKRMSNQITVSGNLNLSKVGVYDITYSFIQPVGEIYETTVKITVIDKTPPVITGLTYNYSSSKENADWLTFEKLIAGVVIKDDGDILDNSRIMLTIEQQPYHQSLLKEGMNIIDLKVSDNNGNTATAKITVNII